MSGIEIGKALGVSRAAVHKQINMLRQKGFIIDSSQKGYKLVKNGDFFDEKAVFARLKYALSVCKQIKHYPKIDSTQTKIKQFAQKNEPEGLIVVADTQTAAYGRMKREWSSAAGGLWFSILLKPKIRPDEASRMAIAISIALNRALEVYLGIKTEIKWPNDILYKGKKLSGIIIEMSAEQDIVNWVAAGIGVNANNKLPKTLANTSISLNEIKGAAIDKPGLLAAFFNEFESVYKDFQKYGMAEFNEEYNSKAAFIEKKVEVDTGFGIIKGINEGIDANGYLLLKTKEKLEKIVSGTLRRV